MNPASLPSVLEYRSAPVMRTEHAESLITRMIEHQTAKVPSEVFLLASLSAMCASFTLEVRGNERMSRFFGMWAAPLLVMGVYNKLVKLLGPR